VPLVSPAALQSLHAERQRGSESFRRGDYAAAHACYTRALAALPPGGHPLAILLLCNRALANLKIGDAKAAAADADAALATIGPSQGHGESITLGGGGGGGAGSGADSGNKDMREFYAKALTRRAEALEQLEKWGDAAQAWRAVLEAGFGGASGIQARDRCERAATAGAGGSSARAQAPTATTTPAAIVGQKPKPAATAAAAASASAASSRPRAAVSRSANAAAAEAVQKLRQANRAAERADEEKFALADAVDAKLAAWKAGRQDNIRALLVSLDSVLWPECGWSKVGMHQLVAANKVKVIYMKGISKVHPDKASSFFF
jgi:tetratricopeptide (TPR) repeat protein